jgi:hypothetical protein
LVAQLRDDMYISQLIVYFSGCLEVFEGWKGVLHNIQECDGGRVITLVKGGRKVSHLFNKQVSLMHLRTLDCYSNSTSF